jgi:isopropylmalate/homocitrate/citramalate synthase
MRCDKLYELAQLTVELTGHRLPQNKSIVGDKLFNIESGIVATWISRCQGPLATEVFPLHWELLGQPGPQVVLGKGSGKDSILAWLNKIGVRASDQDVDRLLVLVKDKAMEKRDLLNEEEFRDLTRQVLAGSQ